MNWLNWFHFLILEGGLLVILIDCVIFLSPVLDVARMSRSTVSFLVQLEIFCLLQYFCASFPCNSTVAVQPSMKWIQIKKNLYGINFKKWTGMVKNIYWIAWINDIILSSHEWASIYLQKTLYFWLSKIDQNINVWWYSQYWPIWLNVVRPLTF